MPLVTAAALLPDPARRLWPLVRWDGRLCDWYPGAVTLSVEGTGKGALRRLSLQNGAALVQRLEHVSRIDMAYTYAVLESPYPVADLLAQIRVQPAPSLDDVSPHDGEPNDHGHATLTWTANFQPAGLSEAEAERFVRTLYEAGIARLRTLLTR